MVIIVFCNLLILYSLNLSINFKENIFTKERQSMNSKRSGVTARILNNANAKKNSFCFLKETTTTTININNAVKFLLRSTDSLETIGSTIKTGLGF